MLVKRASENRLVLPEAALASFPEAECFAVAKVGGRIILTPVRPGRADPVRAKLVDSGIVEEDVAKAVSWAGSAANA